MPWFTFTGAKGTVCGGSALVQTGEVLPTDDAATAGQTETGDRAQTGRTHALVYSVVNIFIYIERNSWSKWSAVNWEKHWVLSLSHVWNELFASKW